MTEVQCWRDQAACLEVVSADYDPFFSDAAELQAEAIAICETCPVRPITICRTLEARTLADFRRRVMRRIDVLVVQHLADE